MKHTHDELVLITLPKDAYCEIIALSLNKIKQKAQCYPAALKQVVDHSSSLPDSSAPHAEASLDPTQMKM